MTPALSGSDLAARVLRHVRIAPPLWRIATGKGVVLGVVALGVVAHAVYLSRAAAPVGGDDPVPRILATLAAGLAFAFSYAQWSLGREEASYDKYYDRMRLTNEHIDAAGREVARLTAAGLVPPGKEPDSPLLDHHRNMIAFAEMDNLEYVLGKRRLDYVDQDIVARAIRTFRARCSDPWFVEKVRYWTSHPESGYRPRTRAAARFLAGLEGGGPR